MNKIGKNISRRNLNHGIRPFLDTREYVPCTVVVNIHSDSTSPAASRSKKYNVKIGENDLVLLDEIATFRGVSRTSIIDQLVMKGLESELLSIKDIDKRTATAIAANKLEGNDDRSDLGWISVAIRDELLEMATWCLKHNIPDATDQGATSEDLEHYIARLKEIVRNERD